MTDLPCITLLNGALGGDAGNTGALLDRLSERLAPVARLIRVDLAREDGGDPARLRQTLRLSRGFVFATGTYWDSWGSPLQRFFERHTDLEGSDTWLGKPAATLVTMHSVGGKEVLSRLQGVLLTLGLELPPMSGVAHSLAGELARRAPGGSHGDDFWGIEDLEVVAHNLLAAVAAPRSYRAWGVDRGDPARLWVRGSD